MVIQIPDSLTPQWLTEKLRAKAVLEKGEVTRIEQDRNILNQGLVADVVRLVVEYSDGDVGSLPKNFILKIPKTNLHAELLQRGAHEIAFYRAVDGEGSNLPVPVCYDAAYDEDSHRYHLLLEDLSGTHYQKSLPIPPSIHQCMGIVESCAQIHAHWWNSPLLGTKIGERMTLEKASAMENRLIDTLPAFMDYLGDALLPFQHQIIENIVGSGLLSRLAQRLSDLQQVTLIHGDAHTGNMLLPKAEEGQRVIFIDWQLWDIHVAAIDLAFMIALHWNSERRALLEEPLLRHYYENLLANGVTGYQFEDFWRDYRESIAIMCLIPVGQFRRKSPAGIIWNGLQNSISAFRDLNCIAVLG